MTPDTLILLPAHNEAGHIASVIAGVRSSVKDADIAVVDDGSTDETAARAAEAGAIVLPLPFNLGYGVALQTGYKYALKRGYRFLAQLDSDGQHDAGGIPKLLERVRSGTCDICVGSRFLEGETYRVPQARRVGMILFRRVASYILGQTITDPTSGFQAMNRHVLEFFAKDSYPADYPDTDVLVMLYHHGFRIEEAPVVMYAGDTKKSIHAGLRPLYYLFKMSLAIPLNLLRRES
ncbi:MAG: glycosyltransferase family 2 protein [Candidatus Hydrogenedentes bacterium]|nr:glycosyltransferase family 2 protein [Candidatus Hydrogenedentota bacterium]